MTATRITIVTGPDAGARGRCFDLLATIATSRAQSWRARTDSDADTFHRALPANARRAVVESPDPFAIAHQAMGRDDRAVDTVVAVVDASAASVRLRCTGSVVDDRRSRLQVAFADVVAIDRLSTVTPTARLEVVAELRDAHPHGTVIDLETASAAPLLDRADHSMAAIARRLERVTTRVTGAADHAIVTMPWSEGESTPTPAEVLSLARAGRFGAIARFELAITRGREQVVGIVIGDRLRVGRRAARGTSGGLALVGVGTDAAEVMHRVQATIAT